MRASEVSPSTMPATRRPRTDPATLNSYLSTLHRVSAGIQVRSGTRTRPLEHRDPPPHLPPEHRQENPSAARLDASQLGPSPDSAAQPEDLRQSVPLPPAASAILGRASLPPCHTLPRLTAG